MSYVPVNVGAYVSAYSGAISGMTTSGWLVDSTHADYDTVTQIAGAFAQAFDTIWANASALNNLEVQAISQIVSENFGHRAPGPQANPRFVSPENWSTTAAACAALVLQSDAYFAGQGIDPGIPVSGGTLISFNGRTTPAVVPTAGDYSSDQVTDDSAVGGPTVEDSLGILNTDVSNAQSTANAAASAASGAQTTANTAVSDAATAQSTANAAGIAATNAQTTANTAVTNAATADGKAVAAQTTANTAVTNAATADAKAVAAQQTFRGTYHVDPLFAGTQLGSESNPFTTIAAAFAAAVTATITRGIIRLAPGANCVENVTFPLTGEWEIAGSLTYGVFATTITGNVDISSTASARRSLVSLQVTGNLTGNCSAGTQRIALLNGVSINGTTTLTVTGAGVMRLATGSAVQDFTGSGILANFLTGAVSIQGQFCGSSAYFGTSLAVSLSSSFVNCLMPPVTTFNTAGGLTMWFEGCANDIGGSLGFTVVGGGFVVFSCDGVTLEEFCRVGTNITGDIRMQSMLGGRSSSSVQVTNVGVTPVTGKLPKGMMVCEACLTLLANGGATVGLAVLNIVYTDMTGTLVTEAVTTVLNVAGAVGSKVRGVFPFSQNGATAPSFSVTGITNATALSYQCDVSVKQSS